MILETKESIYLYYRDTRSDKVYQVQLDRADGGYVVNFQFGRRGSSLQSGTKTPQPLPYEKAFHIYDRLVAEKVGRGYTEGEGGTPHQNSPQAGQQSGLLPQLLNPIDEAQVNRLIGDVCWVMQEKKDGRRLLVRKSGNDVRGVNRKGQVIPLSTVIEQAVRSLTCDAVLDGEAVGDVYWVFDLLELRGEDLRSMSTSSRLIALVPLLEGCPGKGPLRLVPSAWIPLAKRELFDRIKVDRGEGVVFKHIDASYVPGRPNSGGSHLKFKLTADATCYVRNVNSKRSIAIGMEGEAGELVGVGNVTIPANQGIPDEGDLVRIKYLYAYPGGSLYQPV
jgi:bifunctional non-homologous end joining protein LigD